MAKQTVCVKMESVMKAKLQIIAKREGRGTPDVFRAAMLAYIEKYEDKYGRIKEEEVNQMQLFWENKGGKEP